MIGILFGLTAFCVDGSASVNSSPIPLINGGSVSGSISVPGEVDCYSIFANAGDHIVLSVVDIAETNFHPRLVVDLPSGAQHLMVDGDTVARTGFPAPVSGVYTIQVFDISFFGTATASYETHYVRMPDANEHGALTNGGSVLGNISIGDLDTHTFDATVGDLVFLSTAEINDTNLAPQVSIYGPTGALVVTDDMTRVVQLEFTATMTGTYTVLIYDRSFFSSATGAYEIHLARIPGASEFGIAASGMPVDGYLRLGDVDTFTFPVAAGATIDVLLEDTTSSSLNPRVTLYDPTGMSIGSVTNAQTVQFSRLAPQTGTYTVLIHDSSHVPGVGPIGSGSYTLLLDGGAGAPYCFGDGSGTSCPCSANGNPGEGCANSGGMGGASLSAVGTPSIANDTLALHVTGVPGNKPGLILRGSNQLNGGVGNLVGDGLLCTGGNTARSQVQITSSGATVFSAFQGAGFGASSDGAGVPTNYQFWYRDAQNTCSGSGFNFSNAWTVTWLP